VLHTLSSPPRRYRDDPYQASRLLPHLRLLVSLSTHAYIIIDGGGGRRFQTGMTLAAWWKIFVVDFGNWVRCLYNLLIAVSLRERLVGGQNTAAVPTWPEKIHTSLVRKCGVRALAFVLTVPVT
jgi:hypothetical protein